MSEELKNDEQNQEQVFEDVQKDLSNVQDLQSLMYFLSQKNLDEMIADVYDSRLERLESSVNSLVDAYENSKTQMDFVLSKTMSNFDKILNEQKRGRESHDD